MGKGSISTVGQALEGNRDCGYFALNGSIMIALKRLTRS